MPFNLQILENLLHQPEGPALDFKRDQYRFNGANDGEKSELLKDIIALANSWRFLTAYILIGVEERKSGRSRVIGVQEHLDDANLHQFVNSKTQRPIEFSYRQFPVEEKEIGVVEIPLQERPYFLTKPFGKLDANEVKVRDGSSTRTATPDEIIRMGTAGIFNDPPALTMEWADIEYRLWFPSPHDVSSLRFNSLLQSSSIPLPNPDHIIGNRDSRYPDKVISYIAEQKFFTPLGFRLYNRSGTVGKRIRFIGSIYKLPAINLREWLDDMPSPYLQLRAPAITPEMMRNSNEGELTVKEFVDRWEIDIDFGDVRPRDVIWTDCSFYLGSEETCSLSLQGELRGDNLPEPIGCNLGIRFVVERRAMSLDDIAAYVKDL